MSQRGFVAADTGSARRRGSGKGASLTTAEFGRFGVIMIEGAGGDAAHAEANGRFHLLIGGGALSPNGRLRATAGGLRLSDDHTAVLIAMLKRDPCAVCDVIEDEDLPVTERVDQDASLGIQDPFPLHLNDASRSARTPLREGLLGGAMVFGMTVSFVAFQGDEAHASTPQTSANKPSIHDQAGSPATAALPTPRYVKLAYGTGGAATGATTGGAATSGGPPPAGSTEQRLKDMQSGQTSIGKGYDGGTAHDDSISSGGAVTVPTVTAAPVEQPLTAAQRQQLNNDPQYQQYQQQSAAAQKAADEAVAKQQQIQSQLSTTADVAAKSKLQMDLVNARQAESDAKSQAAAAQANAGEIRKKVITAGAPVLLPPKP